MARYTDWVLCKTRTRSNSTRGTPGPRAISEPSEVTKWDPGLTERVMGILRPLIKGYHRAEVRGLENFPPGGALVVSNHSGGLFADGRAGVRDRLLREVRLRPAGLHAEPRHASSPARPATSSARPASSPPTTRTPTRRCAPAASSSSSPAVTTTSTGRRCRRTRSTSTAAPATSGRAQRRACRSCRRCRSAARRASCSCPAATWLAKALRLDKLLRAKILPISFGFPFGLSAVLPVERAAADQDRHAGAAAHRHRRRVRRGPRRRRGRRPRPSRHAAGTRRTGQANAAFPCWADGHGADRPDSTTRSACCRTMVRAGVIAPLRPDKYLRIAAAMARENMGITSGFAVRGAALPRPARPGRRARHPDLARDRPARRRVRRRAAGAARRAAADRSASWPQPPRLRRGADRRQPHRRRRAAAQHVVRRTRAGRGGGARGRRTPSSTTRSSPPTVDRALADAPRRDADRRVDRRPTGHDADRRDADRRARGQQPDAGDAPRAR